MSQNLTPRDVEYRVKSGSRATLELTVNDSSGTAKNLSNNVTYATGVWKVWKPDGTLIINGAITYSDRTNGKVTYALSAADTAIANAKPETASDYFSGIVAATSVGAVNGGSYTAHASGEWIEIGAHLGGAANTLNPDEYIVYIA